MTRRDIALKLRELISALDRRAPRVGHPAEAAIADESATLREEAVRRLAQVDPSSPAE